MNNPFSQSKVTYKISFTTYFEFLEKFEEAINELFEDTLLSISTTEIESATIDSQATDIWQLDAYLNQEPDLTNVQNILDEFANNKNLVIIDTIEFEKIEDLDWVSIYQAALKPIEIDQFFISSKIHKDLKNDNKIGIYIEASRAFGTGDHATTSGCIEALLKFTHIRFKKIIDIGTGTGILSFVAKHLWSEAEILACDIEEVAIEIARENAEFNDLTIEFYQNTEDKILNHHYNDVKFDLIVSNILAGPLIELSNQISELANTNAILILSGFLDTQTPDVVAAFERNGFNVQEIAFKGSWAILSMKMSKRKLTNLI